MAERSFNADDLLVLLEEAVVQQEDSRVEVAYTSGGFENELHVQLKDGRTFIIRAKDVDIWDEDDDEEDVD